MSEENTATPVEASASDEPITEESAEALFNAAGDGKTAPVVETKQDKQEPKAVEPVKEYEPEQKADEPVVDPVKAAETRASEVEKQRQSKIIADEAARIEADRRAAAEKARQESAAHGVSGSDIASIEKTVLAGLKDLKIPMLKDGQEIEASLEDFMDDAKGYGEVARGAIKAAIGIAAKMIEPLQARLTAYEGEKAKAAEAAAHDEFIGKVMADTAHKDAADIEKSDAFWKWMDSQTPQMQALGSSTDIRDIDLLLSAFKSATGYKAQPASTQTRQTIADKQKADLAKADKVSRATSRTRLTTPTEEDDGDIETTEDAEKIFAAASAEAVKKR